jgi:hypothetical protein
MAADKDIVAFVKKLVAETRTAPPGVPQATAGQTRCPFCNGAGEFDWRVTADGVITAFCETEGCARLVQ